MANVMFKRGLAAALPTTGAVEGAFYLTTDTNRLYIGKDGKAVDLNRYVSVVANAASLPQAPAAGDFVYITNGNILAVCTNPTATDLSGIDGKWTQVNPDTNTNDNTKVSSISTPVVTATPDGITVSFNVNQQTSHISGGATTEAAIPVSFTISSENLATSNEVAVDLTGAKSGNDFALSLAGAGAAESASVTVSAGDNVSLAKSTSDKLVIDAVDTTYELGFGGTTTLTLSGSDEKDDSVAFTGDTIINVSATGDTLKVAHKDIATTETEANATVSNNKLTALTGVTTDGKGHIEGYTATTFTLPEDKNTTYEITAIGAGADGKITATLHGSDNSDKTAVSTNADLFYMVNGQKVLNQGSIEFYTKAQIDTMVHGVNAMVYKGTLNPNADASASNVKQLPTSNVQIGDTYKVAVAGNYGGHACDVGDLLIATGTETNGVISGTVTWTYVPSGDDTDSQYSLSLANNTVSLANTTTNGAAGSFAVAAGNDIKVSTANSTLTIAHEAFSTTQGTTTNLTPAFGGDFEVLGGVTVDNGHVTGYTMKHITLPENVDTKTTLSAANNSITATESTGGTSSVAIAAGNDIEVSTSSNTITVAHSDFAAPTKTTGTALVPNHGDKFTILSAVATDNGHLTGYTTQEVTLPTAVDHTYKVSGATAAATNGATYTTTLTGTLSDTTAANLTVTSTSLKVAAAANSGMTVELEWGSF